MNNSTSTEEIDLFKRINKEILRIFLRDHDLVGHNIDSFDQGIDEVINYLEGKEWVQNVITTTNSTTNSTTNATTTNSSNSNDSNEVYRIVFSNVRFLKPVIHNNQDFTDNEILPHDCIERKMSYEGRLRVYVKIIIETKDFQRSQVIDNPNQHVDLMYIPIPVGSKYCNTYNHHIFNSSHPSVFKFRGCFVIKGQKKNIISFEVSSNNIPIFLHKNDIGYYSELRSHSKPILPSNNELTLTIYANTIFMKKNILLFQSRSFKMFNKSKAVTLINVLMNLGLHTAELIENALLGTNPSDELREALKMSLSNSDDYPIPPTRELILQKFGEDPKSLGSGLGRPPSIQAERHQQWATSILEREILPHCGKDTNAKIVLLCDMARRVALANYNSLRGIPVIVDNRDDLCNKTIKGYSDLIQEIVLENLKILREKICKEIRKAEKSLRPVEPLSKTTFPKILTLPWASSNTDPNKMPEASKTIANGQITNRTRGKIKKVMKKGLTQNYGGLNIMYDISCLRNFKNPINTQSKCESTRQIQSSTFGYYCPTETREGQEVGLDHALALQATTTLNGNPDEILHCITNYEYVESLKGINDTRNENDYTLILNGMPIGFVQEDYCDHFINYLRESRRKSFMHCHTSISKGGLFEYGESLKEIHIRCNAGRLSALYLIVNSETSFPKLIERYALGMIIQNSLDEYNPLEVDACNKLINYNFYDLLYPLTITYRGDTYNFDAAIEYIDILERKNILLSEFIHSCNSATTHCMIHPSLLLGSSAAEVPLPDHNQSPRNSYQCGMGKQSIAGRTLTTIIDSQMSPYLLYPQKQLVQTEFSRMLYEKHPCPAGFNAVVAIMSYLYNQEDAIIINRDSIQRGMGVTMHYQSYSDCARNTGLQYESGFTQADKFSYPHPDKVCSGSNIGTSFKNIDDNGIIIVGSIVNDGDPLICKLRKFNNNTHDCILTKRGQNCPCEYANSVTCYHGNDTGIVDNVQVTTNSYGDTLVNVVIRYVRTPQVGDKLSSRHGQKGTIGRVVAREDLPFDENGIPPDIIINPHAIPSRMTIAHLIETLAGMFTCLSGDFVDGTAFSQDSTERWTADKLAEQLQKYGYQKHCEHRMICGISGQMIHDSIFMGPIFYQRMKQMPVDKAHARATGKVMTTTRQPREGRSKKGGFRAGEMERDCLTSHGASAIIQERFMHSSDPYNIYVCDICGRPCIGNADVQQRYFYCNFCKNSDTSKMSIVQLPFAGKLLLQYFAGLRVGVDIITENNSNSI